MLNTKYTVYINSKILKIFFKVIFTIGNEDGMLVVIFAVPHVVHVNHRTFCVTWDRCESVTAPNRLLHQPLHVPANISQTRKSWSFYILVPLNNPATLPIATMTNTSDLSSPEWHHCHMSAPRPAIYIFKGTCSIISNQWVALSLWEPTVEWVSSCQPCFVGLGCGISLLYPSWPTWVFIPAVAFVTFTVRAALSTNHWRHQSKSRTSPSDLKILQCHWKALHIDLPPRNR